MCVENITDCKKKCSEKDLGIVYYFQSTLCKFDNENFSKFFLDTITFYVTKDQYNYFSATMKL